MILFPLWGRNGASAGWVISPFRPLPGSASLLAYGPPQRDPRDLALLQRAAAALDAEGYAAPFAHAPAAV